MLLLCTSRCYVVEDHAIVKPCPSRAKKKKFYSLVFFFSRKGTDQRNVSKCESFIERAACFHLEQKKKKKILS